MLQRTSCSFSFLLHSPAQAVRIRQIVLDSSSRLYYVDPALVHLSKSKFFCTLLFSKSRWGIPQNIHSILVAISPRIGFVCILAWKKDVQPSIDVFINQYGYFWISPLLSIKMSIYPRNCYSESISIICICLDMFSSSCCLFSVAIFSSSCLPIKCPSPASKMVAMSVPSIRMHINMSSTPVSLTLICFPLPYVVILFFYHHIPDPSLPHSNSFSSLLFFLLSSIIPPSHYTYTCCRRGRSLSEQLDLRVMSNMKLNAKLNTYVTCMIHHVLTRRGLRKVEQM